jgi:TetR/AcrR family transcriptional repressor of nem operon
MLPSRAFSSQFAFDRLKTTGHISTVPRPSLREQLLSAGLETLHRKGFNASSVQDITDAAGAPKGSFYNHFESKEVLAAEAVREYQEQKRVLLDILRDQKLAPLRRLRKYFESVNRAAVEAKFSTGCLLGNFAAELSSQSPVICERVGEAFARWGDDVAAVIAEGQRAGAISRNFSSKALADFVIHAWEGAMLRAKVQKDRAPLDLFLKVTFSKILA